VEVGPEGGEAVVRVRDTGIGMSPDMLRRLFQPFAQERRLVRRTVYPAVPPGSSMR
jgi:signal transduction histidine kinase